LPRLFDYNASVVTPATDGTAIPAPLAPAETALASVVVNVPDAVPRFAEIRATVGVRADSGTGRFLLRVFRGGTNVYYSVVGIEADYEKFALLSVLAIDGNSPPGPQVFTLTFERLTPDLVVIAIGPIEMSASSYG